jgi:methylated-DNA-[protein]-cysteine S-methyltransferase
VSEQFFSEAFNTPTGRMLIVTDDAQRVRAAEWEDKAGRMRRLLRLHYGDSGFQLLEARIDSRARLALEAYFAGHLEAIEEVRTATRGTAFQRQVWSALRDIPAGTTLSYSQLAAKIGRPAAVRAVAGANGANPIAVIVPCHRVIGANGSLTGFGGGLERKRWLLAHENRYDHVAERVSPLRALTGGVGERGSLARQIAPSAGTER